MFESSDIGLHPTNLSFILFLIIIPALMVLKKSIFENETANSRLLNRFVKTSEPGILLGLGLFVWILLLANFAVATVRVWSGRNLLILVWLPIEWQFHLLPIDLCNWIIE